MNQTPLLRRTLAFALSLGVFFSIPGPWSFTPALEAASSSASARLIRSLKAQIATLKKQLAAAKATPPPFIEMVKVGNRGNVTDAGNGSVLGAVRYDYQIGKYEVTLAQYAAFLNAVAKTDSFGLFNPNMETIANVAGIDQSGSPGNFNYAVIGTGSRPVAFVSWFDAARFCNWLHNGRPTGLQTGSTTEAGAYSLNGATIENFDVWRNPGAKYWIPSEDEWYKAAYHQPSGGGLGGPSDDYWLYPTGSDAIPGNLSGTAANQANFSTTVLSVTQSNQYGMDVNYLADRGSYSGSASYYGTYDQGGNLWEWNEVVIERAVDDYVRGFRGGSWDNLETTLRSTFRTGDVPETETPFVGFRVAGP